MSPCPVSSVVFAATAALFTSYIQAKTKKEKIETCNVSRIQNEVTPLPPDSSQLMKVAYDMNSETMQVVFVLGGPGSGKGTQCEILVKEKNWAHLSAGDLLRAERKKSDSELGTLINSRIAAGQLVPSEITVRLIKEAMNETRRSTKIKKFLIDGFPRSEGNLSAWTKAFEGSDVIVEFVLFLDCSEEEMTSRIINRGATSGRCDDKVDVIKKRFQTFRDESMPIVDFYKQQGKLKIVAADRTIEAVRSEISSLFLSL